VFLNKNTGEKNRKFVLYSLISVTHSSKIALTLVNMTTEIYFYEKHEILKTENSIIFTCCEDESYFYCLTFTNNKRVLFLLCKKSNLCCCFYVHYFPVFLYGFGSLFYNYSTNLFKNMYVISFIKRKSLLRIRDTFFNI
jgi:hypothetical protein